MLPAVSSWESLSAFSSFEKLDLEDLDLSVLGIRMAKLSVDQMWGPRLARLGAEATPSQWLPLISSILVYLTNELSQTDVKDSIISTPTLLGAENLVNSFKDHELEYWKAGVKSGLKFNDWSELITHSTIRSHKPPKVALGVPVEFKDAVIHAWGLEYHGNAHKILLKAIDTLHMLSVELNYAKLMPIIQSSGMGKSKTANQAATERILFPICLRENIGKNYFAYPPTDKVVRDHLLSAPATSKEGECKQYLRSFLSSLFETARLQVDRLFPPNAKLYNYAYMVKAFYDLFADGSQRNIFYESVIANARNGPYINVWASFNRFKLSLTRLCSDWSVATICPFLISIDEVHVLYTHREADIESDYNLYSRFKSVLNEGIKLDFAVISLSTTSHVPSISPAKAFSLSSHERGKDRILPAPFTELPFDAHIIANPLIAGAETLTSVGTLEFTARFGRPMFYSNYLTRKDLQESNIVDGIMGNIREKLFGQPWPPEAPDWEAPSPADFDLSTIAVLSTRLLLDLNPVAGSHVQQYEGELVRNHLRILYSVHQNRQTIMTGSPSEPLIAEASAQIMNYTLNKKPYMDIWNLLAKFVNHGLAAQGTIGELTGRALCISAMDRAINQLPVETVCELKYQTPVKVANYYKALLTSEAWEDLRQSVPANRAQLSEDSGKKTFEVAFQNAYLHFSHFIKANDSSPMCDTLAWAIWLRGAVVVCQLNQELTDRMTPIYFQDRGALSPGSISVILDQDKTGHSIHPNNVPIQSAEDLSIFSDGHKLPYIASTHCYALNIPNRTSIRVTQASSRNVRSSSNDKEAPRYQIDFCGLNAYGNITDEVKTCIRTMISYSKNEVFNNHPRDYGIPGLRRMLPVATKHPDATHWVHEYEKLHNWNAIHSSTW